MSHLPVFTHEGQCIMLEPVSIGAAIVLRSALTDALNARSEQMSSYSRAVMDASFSERGDREAEALQEAWELYATAEMLAAVGDRLDRIVRPPES